MSTLVTGAVANWVVPGLGVVSALVLGAVAAATGSHPFIDNAVLLFLYAAAVGCAVGLTLAAGVHWARQRLGDSGLETVLGLVVPFAAYLFAEELHASGVLAVVAAGFWLGHHDADAGFATRLQGRQVWRSLDTLLEALVFAYMGLQCRFVFQDLGLTDGEWLRFALSSLLVLLVISWSGMRGVVTLAAAAGVPATTASGAPFPGRNTIQALAFVVAVGSLVVQAPTLPLLVRRLRISADDEQAAEAEAQRLARQLTRTAAEETLRDLLAHPPPGADPVVLGGVRERIAVAMRARDSPTTPS